MYAHRVSVHLKPNSTAAFTQRLEQQVIPMLRKQKGFQDEITFVAPAGKVPRQFWDSGSIAAFETPVRDRTRDHQVLGGPGR